MLCPNNLLGRNKTKSVLPVILMLSLFVFVALSCQQKAETDGDQMQENAQMQEDATTMAEAGNVVEVKLVEFEIQMPTELPAGATTFNITNAGQTEHNIAISNGINEEMQELLEPGESKKWTLNLKPGDYYVWCPVGSHESYGMSLDLKVTE